MREPAYKEDLLRLIKTVDNLDRRLSHSMGDVTGHLKRIHNDIIAALEAIGDERVESESEYAAKSIQELRKIADEVRTSFADIKHCVDDMEVDNQRIKRYLEDSQQQQKRRI